LSHISFRKKSFNELVLKSIDIAAPAPQRGPVNQPADCRSFSREARFTNAQLTHALAAYEHKKSGLSRFLETILNSTHPNWGLE